MDEGEGIRVLNCFNSEPGCWAHDVYSLFSGYFCMTDFISKR